MTAAGDSVAVLGRALDQAGDVLRWVRPDQLAGATPCGDWDVAALVGHLVTVPVHLLEVAPAFGPAVDVPEDAPVYDRLAAFAGRRGG